MVYRRKTFSTIISVGERSKAESYLTIAREGEGKYTVKMSRFLSFAINVASAEEARIKIKEFSNRYHDARHVCWAYVLHAERDEQMSSDNGEPSGTAGRPILGQINSAGLTNVLVVVVRYFGGIKLGTPGLIQAYREGARLALESAGVKEVSVTKTVSVKCRYEDLHKLMKTVKERGYRIVKQELGNECVLEVEMPVGEMI